MNGTYLVICASAGDGVGLKGSEPLALVEEFCCEPIFAGWPRGDLPAQDT